MSALARAAAIAVIGALALATVGCADASPTPTPSTTPTAEAPIFASDEEALAAAEEAYASYLLVLDSIGAAGGRDTSNLPDVATAEVVEDLDASFEAMRDAGVRTAGATAFDGRDLIENTQTKGSAVISMYLCLDVSGVRVLDAAGVDITSSTRPDITPYLVSFESQTVGSQNLLVSESEAWRGDDFCA